MFREDQIADELKRWRERRQHKNGGIQPAARRSVKVNGREIMVVTKAKRFVG